MSLSRQTRIPGRPTRKPGLPVSRIRFELLLGVLAAWSALLACRTDPSAGNGFGAAQAPPRTGHRDSSVPEETILPDRPVGLNTAPPGIRVFINGKGPLRFGLDTGQSTSALLSEETADRLRLPVVSRAEVGDGSGQGTIRTDVVHIDTLELGSAYFRDLQAIVMDVPGDGSLGFALFADCLLTLEVGRSRIRIEKGRLPEPDGKTVLPLDMNRGVTPGTTILAGSRPLPVLLDSGWKGFMSLPTAYMERLPLKGPPVVVGRVATLFNEFDLKTATLDGEIRIGAHVLRDPELQFNDLLPEILIGRKCLEAFAVTFDQRNLRVRFLETGRRR